MTRTRIVLSTRESTLLLLECTETRVTTVPSVSATTMGMTGMARQDARRKTIPAAPVAPCTASTTDAGTITMAHMSASAKYTAATRLTTTCAGVTGSDITIS